MARGPVVVDTDVYSARLLPDRWVAATALRLGISLVSNDRIFEGTPRLVLEAVRS